jgi:hypothetical protein
MMPAFHRRHECPLIGNPYPVDTEEKEQLPAQRCKCFGHHYPLGSAAIWFANYAFMRALRS